MDSTPIRWSDDDDLLNGDSTPEDMEDEVVIGWTFQAEKTSKLKPRSDEEPMCATLKPSQTIPLYGSKQATCAQMSMDGRWLAIGMESGFVHIHSVVDGRLVFTLDTLRRGIKNRSRCTALSVRPSQPGDSSYNVLLSCDLSGQIHFWHITSGMHLGISKEPNHIYAIDFQPRGLNYATAGSDYKVRIYDAVTRTLLSSLSGGNGRTTAGHSNRVFAVKWHPIDVHIVMSGGWDNTIQIWDIRSGHSIRSIFGPKIFGDALDISENGDFILTGSWRSTHQLQEWDFGSGKLFRDIPWQPAWQESKDQPCRLYAAKYGRGISKRVLGAGGSGSNEACLFSVQTGQIITRLCDTKKATHSLSFSLDGSLLAITTTDEVRIVDIAAVALETTPQL